MERRGDDVKAKETRVDLRKGKKKRRGEDRRHKNNETKRRRGEDIKE